MSDVMLPEGWFVTPFERLLLGSQNGCSARSGNGQPTVVLRLADVSTDGTIASDGLRKIPLGERERRKYALQTDDLLAFRVNGSTAITGQVIRYTGPPGYAYCDHFIRLRINSDVIEPQFAAFAFKTGSVRTEIERQMVSSAGQNTVSQATLRSLEVPLAPMPEQRRIVEKVEALLARVNAARERLAMVPAIMKRFRHSVLAAACSGRLTQDWREAHRSVEPPAVRLAELLSKREVLWRGRDTPRRAVRHPKYKPAFEPSVPTDREVPETWVWMTVSHLALLDVGFAFKSVEFADSGFRLLRGENVEPGRLRWKDVRYWPTERATGFEHLLIEPGEIILALDRPVVSAGLKIAKATSEDVPCLLVQRVMRFKMVDVADTDYLYTCLRAKGFIDFITHEGMTGSDLPHITGTGVAEFPIPLPPVEEQREIVSRVAALFGFADAVERRVTAASTRADRLTQAILTKAFRGELVPSEAEIARQQDREYEPASVLLERINSPRAAQNGQGPLRRTARRQRAQRSTTASA